MKIPSITVQKFRKKIFSWWEKNKRDLPWRHTHDPYRILVSEVMLQQTQVSRVLPKYTEFIEHFPTIQDLSRSPVADVIRIWKGLGYNRRAMYLHKLATVIVSDYNGQFPDDEKDLQSLPGVGLYTARAIQVFAWKRDVAMVDTNIRQIFTHYFFEDLDQSPKVIQKFADAIVPKGISWEWHQALMDYGALALPRTKSNKPVSKKISFKDTPRFIRGRIIDLLRDGEMLESNLIDICSRDYKKSNDSISKQIYALINEHLLSKDGDVLRLG